MSNFWGAVHKGGSFFCAFPFCIFGFSPSLTRFTPKNREKSRKNALF